MMSTIPVVTTTPSPGGEKRKRTKQTLAAPRRVLRKQSEVQTTTKAPCDADKLIWVLVGRTEHQAWLLEDMEDREYVLIRWESTRNVERVPVLTIRRELLGRSSRRSRATAIRYVERPEEDFTDSSDSDDDNDVDGDDERALARRKASRKSRGNANNCDRKGARRPKTSRSLGASSSPNELPVVSSERTSQATISETDKNTKGNIVTNRPESTVPVAKMASETTTTTTSKISKGGSVAKKPMSSAVTKETPTPLLGMKTKISTKLLSLPIRSNGKMNKNLKEFSGSVARKPMFLPMRSNAGDKKMISKESSSVLRKPATLSSTKAPKSSVIKTNDEKKSISTESSNFPRKSTPFTMKTPVSPFTRAANETTRNPKERAVASTRLLSTTMSKRSNTKQHGSSKPNTIVTTVSPMSSKRVLSPAKKQNDHLRSSAFSMPKYRTIPGTESLDDIELVSRFMSILSRLDDEEDEDDEDHEPSESSDEEGEDDVMEASQQETQNGRVSSVSLEER